MERASLPEMLGAFSVAFDQGEKARDETSLRTALAAARLAQAAGLSVRDAADGYWTSMLRALGCSGGAHEMARDFTPDDRELRKVMINKELDNKPDMLRRIVSSARPHGAGQVARALAALPSTARGGQANAQCDAGVQLAVGLGLPAGVVAGLDDIEERWDGKGQPNGKRGDEIALSARIACVTWIAVIAIERGATDLARAELTRRRGKDLDPALVDAYLAHAGDVMPTEQSVWDEAVTAEPGGVTTVGEDRVDDVVTTMARFVDLLSVFTLEHSTRVAAIAAAAARHLGYATGDVTTIRRAGLVHDLGRVAVATGTWEKPGPLTVTEREQVRTHAYVTERLLARSPVLAPLARVAGADHERVDGSGYPKALAADQTGPLASLLAAADVWEALLARRPHRSAFTRDAAVTALREEVDARHLAHDAVEAVLAVEGVATRAKEHTTWPAGLTDREVDVLRLVAVGEPNKRIAAELGIAPKTAARHVENLYGKIGARSRAGAALFAVEHGLLRGSNDP